MCMYTQLLQTVYGFGFVDLSYNATLYSSLSRIVSFVTHIYPYMHVFVKLLGVMNVAHIVENIVGIKHGEFGKLLANL